MKTKKSSGSTYGSKSTSKKSGISVPVKNNQQCKKAGMHDAMKATIK